jgi:protein transport protein SEC24
MMAQPIVQQQTSQTSLNGVNPGVIKQPSMPSMNGNGPVNAPGITQPIQQQAIHPAGVPTPELNGLNQQFANMGVTANQKAGRAKRVYSGASPTAPGIPGVGVSPAAPQSQFQQPLSNQFQQPPPNQFQQPTANQFQQPPSNQFQQPLSNQFQQPTANQFQQPPSNQFQQPPPNQFQQPTANQFQQPAPNQFQQPAANQYQQPPPNQYQPNPSGFQPSMQPGGAVKPRIDPDQIPSPVKEHEKDQESYATAAFGTSTRGLPPYSCTRYRGIDEGNSNPRFIRSTLYNVPTSDEVLKASHIPFGIMIQPLADLLPEEAPIPVVDFGKTGPVRCSRCQAYVNPNFQFINGGRIFVCNLCSFSNECPAEYFSNLDMNGRRIDINHRPELMFGSCEFSVQDQYCARNPTPASYLFLIDVSLNAMQSGMVATFASALKYFLYSGNFQLPKGAKVGIVTFDRSLQFYNLNVISINVAKTGKFPNDGHG